MRRETKLIRSDRWAKTDEWRDKVLNGVAPTKAFGKSGGRFALAGENRRALPETCH